MKITTQKEARNIFNKEIKPEVLKVYSATDVPALDEAWNDWTDYLYKEGIISKKAYDMWTRN